MIEKVSELLPCPFCGGKAYHSDMKHTAAGVDMILCGSCGCRYYGATDDKWNARQASSPTDALDKAAAIAATICAHGYLQNPEDEGRVAHVIRQSLASPPADAETVREIIERCAAIAVEYMEGVDSWGGTVSDSGYLRQHIIDTALSRLLTREGE